MISFCEGASGVSPARVRMHESEIAGGFYLLYISIEGNNNEIIAGGYRKLIFLE